jgi:hypothetical protein
MPRNLNRKTAGFASGDKSIYAVAGCIATVPEELAPVGKDKLPLTEGFGNALTRTDAGRKTIQEYTDRLWAGVQEQREWAPAVRIFVPPRITRKGNVPREARNFLRIRPIDS